MAVFAAYTGLFWTSFLAATLLPLGSEWLVALMAGSGHHAGTVVAVAGLGNTLGALTTYALGRWGGEAGWRKISVCPEKREKAERLYRKYGAWSALLSWLPVVGDPLCAVAGVFRMPFSAFVLMAAVGKFGRYGLIVLAAGRMAG